MPDITVHHLTTSRSTRILWFLEELELDYEIVEHRRNKLGRSPDSLKAVHPLGKSPVVVVDGEVLVESGAILETLAERLGEGRLAVPREHEDFQSYRFFLHYAEGSVMLPLLVKLLTNRVRSAPVPFFIKPIARGIVDKLDGAFTDGELKLHAGFLDDCLNDQEWFCADRLTAADIQLCYPIFALIQRGRADQPRLKAWCDRIAARPAWQRALDKGGPLFPHDA